MIRCFGHVAEEKAKLPANELEETQLFALRPDRAGPAGSRLRAVERDTLDHHLGQCP